MIHCRTNRFLIYDFLLSSLSLSYGFPIGHEHT